MVMKANIVIHINEYGPIKNAELKFFPMLLFTGNSNLGKSYINYLFYFLMRSFTWDMFQELVEKEYRKMDFAKKEQTFKLTENDMRKWLVNNVQPFMANFLGDEGLVCSASFNLHMDEVFPDGILNITYSREIREQTEELLPGNLTCTLNINGAMSVLSMFANDKQNEVQRIAQTISLHFQNHMFGHAFVKSVVLPPARGSYVGESFSAKEMIASQAGMYKFFLNDYDLALHGFGNGRTEDEQFFQARVKKLVGGDLVTKEGKQYLALKDRLLPLTAAASSIKELSPFLFYLKNWAKFQFSFCIEEPEAHLHPTMQKDIADLLASCLNKGMFFQMTTHSDYFLQRINQLLLLGELRKTDSERYETFRKEHDLNQRFFLDKENVCCYYFYEEGENIKIAPLTLGKMGIPMKSFSGIVEELTSFGDDLEIALNPEDYGNN